MTEFDDQQKQWLQGFVSGLEARKAADKLANRSAAAAAPSNLDALQTAAQDRALAAGGKLSSLGRTAFCMATGSARSGSCPSRMR